MVTDTLEALLECVSERLEWTPKTIVTAPGAGLTVCPDPLLGGSIVSIRRSVAKYGVAFEPPEFPRRRMIQLELRLAQCVPTEAAKTTDISGTEINDRIEETDQAIYCCLTEGFVVFNEDGTDDTFVGYIVGESFAEPVEGGQQVTTWTVETEECFEECE